MNRRVLVVVVAVVVIVVGVVVASVATVMVVVVVVVGVVVVVAAVALVVVVVVVVVVIVVVVVVVVVGVVVGVVGVAFVVAQADHLIKDVVNNSDSQFEKIKQLYQTLFQREPTSLEIEVGAQYIQSAQLSHTPNNLAPLARYAQLLLCTNEFEFID